MDFQEFLLVLFSPSSLMIHLLESMRKGVRMSSISWLCFTHAAMIMLLISKPSKMPRKSSRTSPPLSKLVEHPKGDGVSHEDICRAIRALKVATKAKLAGSAKAKARAEHVAAAALE